MHRGTQKCFPVPSLTITDFKEKLFCSTDTSIIDRTYICLEHRMNFEESQTLPSFHGRGMGYCSFGKLGILLAPPTSSEDKM